MILVTNQPNPTSVVEYQTNLGVNSRHGDVLVPDPDGTVGSFYVTAMRKLLYDIRQGFTPIALTIYEPSFEWQRLLFEFRIEHFDDYPAVKQALGAFKNVHVDCSVDDACLMYDKPGDDVPCWADGSIDAPDEISRIMGLVRACHRAFKETLTVGVGREIQAFFCFEPEGLCYVEFYDQGGDTGAISALFRELVGSNGTAFKELHTLLARINIGLAQYTE